MGASKNFSYLSFFTANGQRQHDEYFLIKKENKICVIKEAVLY